MTYLHQSKKNELGFERTHYWHEQLPICADKGNGFRKLTWSNLNQYEKLEYYFVWAKDEQKKRMGNLKSITGGGVIDSCSFVWLEG